MSLDYTKLVVAASRGLSRTNPNILIVEIIQNNHEHFQREFLVNLKRKDNWARQLESDSVVFLLNKFWSGNHREFTELAPLGHQPEEYQGLSFEEPAQSKFDFEKFLDESVIDVQASNEPLEEEPKLLLATGSCDSSEPSKPVNSIHIKNLDTSFMDQFDEVLELSRFRYKTMLAKRLMEIALPIYRQAYADALESQRRL